MHSNSSRYQLKIDCSFKLSYGSFMVTTKQTPTVDTKKRKGCKCTTAEKHQTTKEESKKARKQESTKKERYRNYKTARKQQNGNEHIPINNT